MRDSKARSFTIARPSASRSGTWRLWGITRANGLRAHVRWQAAKPSAPMPLAFAFELDETAYILPPERRRPRSFIHAYIFREREQYYWDPEKWEAEGKK